MLLRGRGPEEQLLPDWRVGRSPHSSALFNGAAHEYCMTPAVGLQRSGAVPGRAEPWCRAGAEPSAPAARGAFTLMRTMQSAARPPSVQPDLSGGGCRRCYDNSGKVHGVEDLSKSPIRTFFLFFLSVYSAKEHIWSFLGIQTLLPSVTLSWFSSAGFSLGLRQQRSAGLEGSLTLLLKHVKSEEEKKTKKPGGFAQRTFCVKPEPGNVQHHSFP